MRLRSTVFATVSDSGEQHLRWLTLLSPEQQAGWLQHAVKPHASETTLQAAVLLVEWSGEEAGLELLLDRFVEFTPSTQQNVLKVAMQRKSSVGLLLAAVEDGRVQRSSFSPQAIELIHRREAAEWLALATAVGSQPDPARAELVQRYAMALHELRDEDGAGEVGREIFLANCSACHRLHGLGNDVGPPLREVLEKSDEQLLQAVLDPNGEVDPRYSNYQILLQDGRLLAGAIRNESANSLTLVVAGGEEHQLERSELQEVKNSGRSLMPEGFEQKITPKQMQALLGFLRSGR